MKTKTKKIVEAGQGYLIYLPIDFVRASGIAKGDSVAVAYDENRLMVLPIKEIDDGRIQRRNPSVR